MSLMHVNVIDISDFVFLIHVNVIDISDTRECLSMFLIRVNLIDVSGCDKEVLWVFIRHLFANAQRGA